MLEEDVIVGSDTDHPLPGRLSLPDGEKCDLPAALLVHGSGPNDRDERVGNNAPFRDLALSNLSSLKSTSCSEANAYARFSFASSGGVAPPHLSTLG
ncbi:hypothetical protein [Alicyclobacillus mali (ex Roth et al. 2021)]|uniref:hypothetical protein n=1 Tax=Alicyclobacillus mali (ex Roth et al. 2021) TaxID=1123961 RepID=UPI001F5DDFB1|nr:hypothetical protein [Alicyclobacillus mali (ex Roth et al. 2021)]